MISCYELRIGNYVLVDDRPSLVLAITDTSLSTVDAENQVQAAREHGWEYVNPVPLTDDLLRQCGFVYHGYFKFWQLIAGSDGNRSEMDIDKDYAILDFMRRPIIRKVLSLHQLQNIYFMLKDRELIVRKKVAAVNN